ncbi:MAG: hypothetical protein P0Y64_16700 [Candidatus Sphingomonas colombiensis]|nr:hypothetical protein [Sphingomonas sp.]WEK42959.1 MAG: hypothetical protein P0Y64_16700 [Sphingomonas sp.]
MRPRFSNASKAESVQSATTRLIMLLANCSDAALAGFTVDHLVATHRVDRNRAKYELTIARQRRTGQISNEGIQS